jgi:hypothetical protein
LSSRFTGQGAVSEAGLPARRPERLDRRAEPLGQDRYVLFAGAVGITMVAAIRSKLD